MSDPLRASDLHGLPPAGDVFTDRVSSKELFAARLAHHASGLSTGAIGREDPRSNIMSFYGIGGVGKTQLLLRLKGWATGDQTMQAGWGKQPLPRAAYGRYCDLGKGWAVDSLLLTLRSMAVEAGVKTRAFDVGLYAWWTSTHPGQELSDVGKGIGNGWTSAIRETATAALKEAGIPFGVGWLTGMITDQITRAAAERQRQRTIAECEDLQPVLHAIATNGTEQDATAIAQLLDWDLRQLSPSDRPALICYVDRYETVQAEGPVADQLMRRLVFATPHVLWVVAGRRRLTWGDTQSGTDGADGPDRWPGLVPGTASDQHTVGMLDREDVDDYLARVLVAPDGSPLLATDVRAAIADASDGWPIYLDWACEHVRGRLQRRETLRVSDVGQPLKGLISRVADDLPAEHRRALNAAALVQSFDAGLIAAGAQIDEGSAMRFLLEPIVNVVPSEGAARHQLHDVVRKAIRASSLVTAYGWSANDWSAAGERMLTVLEQRASATKDADERLDAALAGFDIASELTLEVPWVVEELFKHPARARVARQVAGRSQREQGSWTASVARVLSCWQPDGSGLSTPDRLAAVAGEPDLAPDLRRRALRQRAYQLRTLTQHRLANEIFSQLRAERDDPLLRLQHALTLVHLGCFEDALALKHDLEASGQASKADRIGGEIAFQHGHIADAIAATERRRQHAIDNDDGHNAMELQVSAARQKSLLSGAALPDVEAAITVTQQRFAIGHLRSAMCSRALCTPDDPVAVEAALADCSEWMRRFDQDEDTVHEAIARMFHAAVLGDSRAAARAQQIMDDHERARDARWLRQLTWWRCLACDEEPPSFADAQWLRAREHRSRPLARPRPRPSPLTLEYTND